MKFTRTITAFVIFLAAFVFNSCKNDLKLNAPYKELPSIYAVISPQDPIKIIRVNKIFLGESDANETAKIADSINYEPGELTVTLDRYMNGNHVDACPTCPQNSSDRRTITFRDSVVMAAPGAFNTQQRVYVSSADLHIGKPVFDGNTGLNTNPDWKVAGDYVLTVKNNKTGNIFTSKSTIVDSVSGNQQIAPFEYPYYPYKPGEDPKYFVDYSVADKTYNIYYAPKPTTGDVYQVVIRIHFYDLYLNGVKDYKYVDYTLGNQYPKDVRKIAGQTLLVSEFKGKDVLSAAATGLARANLPTDINGRKVYKIQYFVYSSTNDYIDYLQFTAPSLNISQSKPLYSNFANRDALGIFTFRSRCAITKEVAGLFVSAFQANSSTCGYQFYNADDSRKGCN